MKTAYVTKPFEVQIKDTPPPGCGGDDVLIRTVYTGVCGSDLHLFRGTHAFRSPPAVLGHEIAGEVIRVGPDVKNIKPGDRVTVEPQIGCGVCEFCRTGYVNLCASKIVPGTPKWAGTFSELFAAPEKTIHKLADSVSYQNGVMIEPLAVAVHSMEILNKQNKSIVILGSGSIGLLCLIVAKQLGYTTIICTDTAPFNREMAVKLGADLAMDPVTEDVPSKVKELTNGKGADAALVAAGAENIMDQAASSVRKLGEICLVAMITERIPVYTYSLVFNEQRVLGSMTYPAPSFKKAVDMVNDGLDLSMLVTQTMDVEQTQEALTILSEKKEDVVKVLVSF